MSLTAQLEFLLLMPLRTSAIEGVHHYQRFGAKRDWNPSLSFGSPPPVATHRVTVLDLGGASPFQICPLVLHPGGLLEVFQTSKMRVAKVSQVL